MTALAVLAAAYGTYLLYTAIAFRWRGLSIGPAVRPGRAKPLSLAHVRATLGPALFAACAGAAVTYAVFGAPTPALAVGALASACPANARRRRDERRRARAREAWPRLLDELRVLTGAAGRSIPQALFEVGRRAPVELRPAFAAANREWVLTTDFEHTIAVLKDALDDPTADAACETLLIAHAVGGRDLDRRLEALVEDRIQDVQGRKDGEARQAGVRFARRFVLLVPVGMALAGMSVGPGRSSYSTPAGQVAAAVGVALVGACWVWAGRIMRLPEPERVFR